LINNIPRKNKVFFSGTFGFAWFYFYIFIREQDLPAGGETGWLSELPGVGVFRRVGKLFVRLNFPDQDGGCRPFFMSCLICLLPLQ